jgi:hypothetical protein
MKKRKKKKSYNHLPPYLGSIGIFLIIFAQVTNFLKIEPFVYWYIAMMWYGYILIVDSIVYLLKKNSFIINRPKKFIVLAVLSTIFWLIFEFYNLFLPGWSYVNVPGKTRTCISCYFAISTILPAIFETMELIKGLKAFHKSNIHKIKIHKLLPYISVLIGLIFIIVPFFYPSAYMWILVWAGFIFLLDPINYFFHEDSLISQLKSGKLKIILSIFLAGYICGFFWEFWNSWAYTKWQYDWQHDIPVFGVFKIFEMPILGYIPYGFFAWELYAMYYFVKLLFPKKLEKELELD